jgi:hypothetical protein
VVTRPIWSYKEATSLPVSPPWRLTAASWPATAIDFARSRPPQVPKAAAKVDQSVKELATQLPARAAAGPPRRAAAGPRRRSSPSTRPPSVAGHPAAAYDRPPVNEAGGGDTGGGGGLARCTADPADTTLAVNQADRRVSSPALGRLQRDLADHDADVQSIARGGRQAGRWWDDRAYDMTTKTWRATASSRG